jgi:hypothetical protein
MRRAVCMLLFALLTACGGGGSGTPAAAGFTGSTTLSSANVTVEITVPRDASSSARAPQYVSSGTANVSVSVAGITTTAACASPATTCSVQVAAPLGNDTFAVSLFDTSMDLLATGSIAATITANIINTISLTFNGVIHSLTLSLSVPTIAIGTAAASVLTILAKDAAGDVIVPPGNYTQPIVVTQSPVSVASISVTGATTISTIPAASSTLHIAYSGAVAPVSVVYTATAGTVTQSQTLTFPAPGGVTVSSPLLQFTTVPAGAQTETVSETNYNGTFSDSAPGCSGIANVGSVAGTSFGVTPIAAGACTVTVSDTIGNTQTFNVHVATTAITGS